MSIENLHPYATDHAIQNVAFVLAWQGDLSDQTLLAIHALSNKLKDSFPVVEIQKLVMFNIAGPQAGQVPNTEGVGGVSFTRNTSFGTVAKQLVVSRQSCVFIINDYIRWANALSDVMNAFSILAPLILANRAINTINLQYTDVFTWKDDPDLLKISEVFNVQSGLLPVNVFEQKGFWHSHHGYMSDAVEPVKHTSLNNVNVNVADVSGERTINVVMSHQATLSSPLRRGTPDFMKVISDMENYLHSVHKDILKNLLTKEVCEVVGLNK
jgi:uncharacterized protein (TIGR04255 family)